MKGDNSEGNYTISDVIIELYFTSLISFDHDSNYIELFLKFEIFINKIQLYLEFIKIFIKKYKIN